MAKEKNNPLSEKDIKNNRIVPELEGDNFSEDEQKEIVTRICELAKADREAMVDWLADRDQDIKQYDGERPSILEGLSKRPWQSDRNLGLCAAVSDTYQSVLLATAWNPDSIHYLATETNDFSNAQNKAAFTKWGMGKQEADFFPELYDYVWNKINQGFSVFKIQWEVKYMWVDKRIPQKIEKKDGSLKRKYKIKTEKIRIEKGKVRNVDNLEDMLIPTFGKNIQELDHIGEVLHITGSDLLDLAERNIIPKTITEDFLESIKQTNKDNQKSISTEANKKEITGEGDQQDLPIEAYPFDIIQMFMTFKKNGKEERYRFWIEEKNRLFLHGKPLRKITRTGKYPYVGGGFIKIPGRLKGKSLNRLIAPIVNAFNNVFNQKTDFQTIENMPFGFNNPDEGFTKQVYELEPGKVYPVSGSPKDAVYFPNNSRSFAWADQDYRILFELLERLTGAASYFQTQQRGASNTATRDIIVQQNSSTRFGLWVNNLQDEIAEAITMWMSMYQDWAPKSLGERVLGEDGKQLISNLSIESLMGEHDARLVPDITSGSKVMEQQIYEKAFTILSQTIWLQPQLNPSGNYNFISDVLKKMGLGNVQKYMGQEPPKPMGDSKLVKDEWQRFLQGESFPPNPDDNVQEHLIGHMKQKDEKYYDLDEEYRANFDDHIFQTFIQFSEYVQKRQEQAMANNMAMQMIAETKGGIRDEADIVTPPTPPPMVPGAGVNTPVGPMRTQGVPNV